MAKQKQTASVKAGNVRLSQAAKLLRLPPGVRDQGGAKGAKRIKLVSIVDLPSSGFVAGVSNSISLNPGRFNEINKYVLKPYDLLMSIQGTVGVIGILPEKISGAWMANISLLTIRFLENKFENAIALLAYLRAPAGKNAIKSLEKGTTIKRINVKDFAKIQIPELNAQITKEAKKIFDSEIKTFEKIDALLETIQEVRSGYLKGK